MAPQLQLSTYTEEFGSPGRGNLAHPRPSSAHRRNNPHPRPDFLLPRKLHTSHRSFRSSVFQVDAAPADNGRPLFPPVRHLSFHNPDGHCAPSLSAVDTDGACMPSRSSRTHALPPAGWLHKPKVTEPSIKDRHNQPPLETIQRRYSSIDPLKGLTDGDPPGARHLPQVRYRRFRSESIQDSCAGYSCFHVVKPYQPGHYIIHPEFVSECLH